LQPWISSGVPFGPQLAQMLDVSCVSMISDALIVRSVSV
jgi:hypothetical protein